MTPNPNRKSIENLTHPQFPVFITTRAHQYSQKLDCILPSYVEENYISHKAVMKRVVNWNSLRMIEHGMHRKVCVSVSCWQMSDRSDVDRHENSSCDQLICAPCDRTLHSFSTHHHIIIIIITIATADANWLLIITLSTQLHNLSVEDM